MRKGLNKGKWLFLIFAMLLLFSGCSASKGVQSGASKTETIKTDTTVTETTQQGTVFSTQAETAVSNSVETEQETIIETIIETEIETEIQTEAKDENEETEVKAAETDEAFSTEEAENTSDVILEDGWYSSKEEVALYIHTFGHLPGNYLTKSEAEAQGWRSSKGNLWEVCEGMSIGGDKFGNYEKLLPTKKGRKYYECDIDYSGGYRGEKRIIFSNDGLVYYTEDHYNSFELLYE